MRNRNNRKITKNMVILYIACAVISTFATVIKWLIGAPGWDLGIYAFCAVVWITTAVMSYRKYKNDKDEGGAL